MYQGDFFNQPAKTRIVPKNSKNNNSKTVENLFWDKRAYSKSDGQTIKQRYKKSSVKHKTIHGWDIKLERTHGRSFHFMGLPFSMYV